MPLIPMGGEYGVTVVLLVEIRAHLAYGSVFAYFDYLRVVIGGSLAKQGVEYLLVDACIVVGQFYKILHNAIVYIGYPDSCH